MDQDSVVDDQESIQEDTDVIEDMYNYMTTSKYPVLCSENRKRCIRRKSKQFVVEDGILFYIKKSHGKEKLLRYITSSEEKLKILHGCHVDKTAGHMGREKTINRINERYRWLGIVKDVNNLLKKCDVCQKMNRKLTTGTPQLHPVPVVSPWYQIGMDYVGPISPPASDGSVYIFTVCDYFTKWVDAIPTSNKFASTVANHLYKLFMRMGLPHVIVSDNGTEFNNELEKNLSSMLGIKRRLATPYHPQANGLVERFNQTLQNMLVKYVQQKKEDWSMFLDSCVFAYNTSRHESTQFTPFELMFNRCATLPIDTNLRARSIDGVVDFDKYDKPDFDKISEKRTKILEEAKENIVNAQKKQKKNYDRKHAKPHLFAVGQLVLKKDFLRKKRKGGKLDARFLGPYKVVKKLSNGIFELLSSDEKTVRVTGAHLKPYFQPIISNSSKLNLTSPLSSPVKAIRVKSLYIKHDQESSCDLSDSIPPLPSPISTIGKCKSKCKYNVSPHSPSSPVMSAKKRKIQFESFDDLTPPLFSPLLPTDNKFICSTPVKNTIPFVLFPFSPVTSFLPKNCDAPAPFVLIPSSPSLATDQPLCPPKNGVAANTQKKKPKLTLAGEKDKKRRMRTYPKSVDPSKPIIDLVDLSVKPLDTTKSSKFWIEELNLYPSQKQSIINGNWLCDGVIEAAQKLMKKAYPMIKGLQSPILGETLTFDIHVGEFVQVINVSRAHWITISTIGCSTGEVNVYDSLMSCDLSSQVKQQIASICFSRERNITLNFRSVQQQQGGSDCGLYSLAFALSLCTGKNPSVVNYIQHKLRTHLVECLEQKNIVPFPSRTRSRMDKGSLAKKKFPIYCLCRQPRDNGRMVECEKCNEWFHEDCIDVPSEVWEKSIVAWKCKSCQL